MLKLKMIEGPSTGREYPLPEEGSIVMGRRSSCNVQVADPKASRVHAEISAVGGFLYIRDMGSRNGTLMNGRRLESDMLEVLETGDRVSIGDTTYEVEDESLKEIPTVDIPSYEIVDTIGRGGMGTVYKARQVSMDRIVAVKVLHEELCQDANFINRFVQEARAAGRLSHPNIVHVFDVDKLGSVYYFTMEYVDGDNVKRAIKKTGSIPVDEAGRIILQAAKALAYAHEQNVIHRDVKPDNLMLTRDGLVKLADLGIARTIEEPTGKGEKASKVYGTPHYMAPEQALGKPVDARADIYSLGATFYNMLTGRTPFTGTTVTEVLKAHVQDALPPITEYNADVPEGVCHVCERMMAKKPEKRYQSMKEVVADLEKALEDQAAEIAPPEPSESNVIPAASPQAVEFRRRRAQRQRPAWKKAVSGVITVVFFCVLFVATYFVVSTLLKQPDKPTIQTEDDTAKLRKEAEEILLQADKAIADGILQVALGKLLETLDRYPDFPDIVERATNKIEKVNGMIAEAQRQAAQAAFDEATSVYNLNPGEPERAQELFDAIVRKWPKTAVAAIAKVRAEDLRKEIEERTSEGQDMAFQRAKAAAGSFVARRDYDAAVQKLREFAARYSDSESGNEAAAEADRLEKEIEDIYHTREKEANQRIEKQEYGLAISLLDQFIKSYTSVKWRAEAAQLKTKIQGVSMLNFQKDCQKPNAMVAQFRFEEAISQFQTLRTRYDGTQWGIFAMMRLQSIQAQADLHSEIVHRVKMAARKGEQPRLPFEMENFRRIKFRMVGADEKQLFVEGEVEPKFRQPFDWVDFTGKQVYDIYRVYMPNPTEDDHASLGYFCQERDLVDEADEHFGKSGM